MLVLILYGWYNAAANLRWHEHAIPLNFVTLFPGSRGVLLKSNLVPFSPKNMRLMKRTCAASNEREAAGTSAEDVILKDLMELTYPGIFPSNVVKLFTFSCYHSCIDVLLESLRPAPETICL